MNDLSAEDYRAVLAAVERLGADDGYTSFPLRAIEAVATAIEVDFASFSEINPATGTNRFFIRPDPADLPVGSGERARLVRRFGNHPILAYRLVPGTEAPGTFLSRIRLMGMVGNCCGEVALTLDVAMDAPDHRLVGLAINRGTREFSKSDVGRLEALKPHLTAAFRTAMRFERLESRPSASGITLDLRLTDRESEVLHWVAMGKTNEEVGTIVGAKPMTIKKHLEHIYDKLGVPNRTAAARLVAGQHA